MAKITTTSNADLVLEPNGTGDLDINTDTIKIDGETTTLNLLDNSATALTVQSSDGTDLMVLDTTNSAEKVSIPATLAVDTISEKTSTSGVTIDGTLIKDNAIKPASGQSLVLQEDGGSAALTVDTGGNLKIHGNFVTGTTGYSFAGQGELNSIGYFKPRFFGAMYYLSADHAVASTTDTEIDATWTIFASSGTSGSTNADPFGKFSSGRWTPTIPGFYLCTYSLRLNGLTDQNTLITKILKNSTGATSSVAGQCMVQASGGTDNVNSVSNGSGILAMDTDDYASVYCYHDNSGSKNVKLGNNTNICFYFLGSNF